MSKKNIAFRSYLVFAAFLLTLGSTDANQNQFGEATQRVNSPPPSIIGIITPKRATYTSKTAMAFKVIFSKPVLVVGKPTFPLGIGTTLREGSYVSGSGTSILKFQVTPLPGDIDRTGVRLMNTLLSDGSNFIKSSSGDRANVTLTERTLLGVIVDDPSPAEDHPACVSTINGEIPPLTATTAKKSEVANDRVMLTGDGYARRALVIKTTRAPGTRAPIHEHEYSGTTTVVQGEMTLYMEGHEPMKAVAGQSYFMPPGHKMTGVNTGEMEAIMYDSYVLPSYARNWRPVEPGFVECLTTQ